MTTKRLYLVGGGPGAGKTTVARQLRDELGSTWIEADMIWRAVLAAFPEDSAQRERLMVERAIFRMAGSASDLVAQHIEIAQFLRAPLSAAIAVGLEGADDSVIIDGTWLLPEWMQVPGSPGVDVRAVILHEADPDEVRRAMFARHTVETPKPFQTLGVEVSAGYGDWLHDEAVHHGVTIVAARPRETLLDRVRRELGIDH